MKTDRLGFIDNLRGIAALSVIIAHIVERLAVAGPDVAWIHVVMTVFLRDVIDLGRFGVTLFFMVSGYIIPLSFKGQSPLKSFAISRFFRLYPAYWFSILCALLVGWLASAPSPSFETVLANVTMLQRLFGQDNIRIGYWTLFFEMVFYAMCALLFWRGLLNRVSVLGWLTLALIVSAAVPPVLRAASGHHFPAPEDPIFLSYMFLGGILRIAFAEGGRSARRWAITLVAAEVLAALVLSGTFFPLAVNKGGLPASRLIDAYLLAIAVFTLALWTQRPDTSVGRWLGQVSYSLYLNQGTWLALALAFYPPTSNVWQQFVFFVLVFAASLLSSGLTYRYIEEPCIALARRLTHRQVPRVAQEVAP